jgi:hypothetical protein
VLANALPKVMPKLKAAPEMAACCLRRHRRNPHRSFRLRNDGASVTKMNKTYERGKATGTIRNKLTTDMNEASQGS